MKQNLVGVKKKLYKLKQVGLKSGFCVSVDSLGRVLVVPFQNVSLKGILVKFWPIFSAFSVSRKKCMMDLKYQNCMLTLKKSEERYL